MDALEEYEERDLNANVIASLAAILTLRAKEWLQQRPEIEALCVEAIRTAVAKCERRAVRSRGSLNLADEEFAFTAKAVAARWLEGDPDWDRALIIMMTCDDGPALEIIMRLAEARSGVLGDAWWRLNQIAVFWAALSTLRSSYGEEAEVSVRWLSWLDRLRGFAIRDVACRATDLDLVRLEDTIADIMRIRWRKQYAKKERRFSTPPEDRRAPGLDSRILGHTFAWLLDLDQPDDPQRRALVLQLWRAELSSTYNFVLDAEEEGDEDEQRSERLDQYGYSLVERLAHIAATGSDAEADAVFDVILPLGLKGKSALGRFIGAWFGYGKDPSVALNFVPRWRRMLQTMLAEGWGKGDRWFDKHSLLRQLCANRLRRAGKRYDQ